MSYVTYRVPHPFCFEMLCLPQVSWKGIQSVLKDVSIVLGDDRLSFELWDSESSGTTIVRLQLVQRSSQINSAKTQWGLSLLSRLKLNWQPRFRLPTLLHLAGACCRFERTINLPVSCNKFVSLIHFLYSIKLRTIWLHETLYCGTCFKMNLHGSGSAALLGLRAPRCHMLLMPRRLHEALTDNRLALSGGQGSNNKAPRRL